MVKSVPEGYHTVTPFLRVTQASQLIEFLKKVFGAVEEFRMDDPSGRVAHAEIRIGDSKIMIGEVATREEALPGMLHLYLPDTDAVYQSALAAGAQSVREPADQFYGDRSAGIRDMCGNEWWIATHIEDVAPQEMERRMAAMAARK